MYQSAFVVRRVAGIKTEILVSTSLLNLGRSVEGMYQSAFVNKMGCGNQKSNTGRHESFYSRQKWRESCPSSLWQNYYERLSACFSKVCVIALLLLEGSWESKLDYRSVQVFLL